MTKEHKTIIYEFYVLGVDTYDVFVWHFLAAFVKRDTVYVLLRSPGIPFPAVAGAVQSAEPGPQSTKKAW